MTNQPYSVRQQKVSRLLENTFNEFFRLQAANFDHAMITATQVWVAKDLKMCRVYLSIYKPTAHDKEAILALIQAQNKPIRAYIGNKLGKQLQFIPELFFRLDDRLDQMDTIEKLLKSE